jgi:hypothetical protein
MPFPAIVWVVVTVAVGVAARVAVRAAINAAPKVIVQVAKKVPQAAAKVGKKKGSNTTVRNHVGNKQAKKPPRKKKKDPCKHKNDEKKRKYVVYKDKEYKSDGTYKGVYVGRTSGTAGEKTKDILARRERGHHRNVRNLESIFETNSYAAVRGSEQILIDKYSTIDQIRGLEKIMKRKKIIKIAPSRRVLVNYLRS